MVEVAPLSEAELVEQVEAAKARYKELFVHYKVVTNGGRADLKTLKHMGEEGTMANEQLRGVTGDLPGLPVNAEFHNKCEMQVLGMHCKWLSGIDYVPANRTDDGVSYATAVVSSGGYEDDEDDGDTLWYTGEGGNDLPSRCGRPAPRRPPQSLSPTPTPHQPPRPMHARPAVSSWERLARDALLVLWHSRRQTAAQQFTKGNLALVGNIGEAVAGAAHAVRGRGAGGALVHQPAVRVRRALRRRPTQVRGRPPVEGRLQVLAAPARGAAATTPERERTAAPAPCRPRRARGQDHEQALARNPRSERAGWHS